MYIYSYIYLAGVLQTKSRTVYLCEHNIYVIHIYIIYICYIYIYMYSVFLAVVVLPAFSVVSFLLLAAALNLRALKLYKLIACAASSGRRLAHRGSAASSDK